MPTSDRTSAFTLIELLIVVAIIAILAAIAIPNFLQAQTRAKVSRVLSDLRTVTLALEAYRLDTNAYPPNDGAYNVLPRQITTPVAFLTRAALIDPFCERELHPVYGELARFYTYGKVVNQEEFLRDTMAGVTPPVEMIDMAGFNPGAREKYGPWRLVSNGPDRQYSSPNLATGDPILLGSDILYDPTNGTVSWGNILRTQKSVSGKTIR